MPFTISAQQLKLLKKAIDDYCRDCGISDNDEQLYVADLATSLFALGAISQHDLRRGLESAIGPCAGTSSAAA